MGIELATTERDADGVVTVELNVEEVESALGSGMVEIRAVANGQEKFVVACASSSSDVNADLFSNSVDNVVNKLKENVPDKSSIAINSGSNFSELPKFQAQLLEALKAEGFSSTETSDAITSLRVKLVRQKLKVRETNVKYKFEVITRSRSNLSSGTGTDVMAAKLAEITQCQSNPNLRWLTRDDTLFRLAKQLAGALNRENTGEKDPDVPDIPGI